MAWGMLCWSPGSNTCTGWQVDLMERGQQTTRRSAILPVPLPPLRTTEGNYATGITKMQQTALHKILLAAQECACRCPETTDANTEVLCCLLPSAPSALPQDGVTQLPAASQADTSTSGIQTCTQLLGVSHCCVFLTEGSPRNYKVG